MNQLELITTSDELGDEVDSLWAQGVNLDDWDYILVAHTDFEWDHWQDRLLTGCCSNIAYERITFRGREVSMGIAYHA